MQTIIITNNEAGQRTDKFLRKLLPQTPLGEIYKMLRTKKIKINGKKTEPKYQLQVNDIINIYQEITVKKAAKIPQSDNWHNLKIIYEDQEILIVDKPCGILTHPAARQEKNSLIQQCLSYLAEKQEYLPEQETTFTPAACNRLDRNTSGLVIIAKTFPALQTVNALIREKKISKYYLALVKGSIKQSGEIKGFLSKDQTTNTVKVHAESKPESKEIHTFYQPLFTNDFASLLEINLLTGRTHQIRAHLASIGHPLAGDRKYGEANFNQYFLEKYHLKHQFLHAYKLVFPPSSPLLAEKTITAALPTELKHIKNKAFPKNHA